MTFLDICKRKREELKVYQARFARLTPGTPRDGILSPPAEDLAAKIVGLDRLITGIEAKSGDA